MKTHHHDDGRPTTGRRPAAALTALALLALGSTACSSGSDASAEVAPEPPAASAEAVAAEAPEPEAPEPEAWDQEARDGDVVFRVRNLACFPIASNDEGEPIKANGKGCEATVEVVNESDQEVVLRQRSFVLVNANGDEQFAHSQSPILFTPRVAPGESVSKDVGWVVSDYDTLVIEARLHAGDESEGAVFTVEDKTA